MKKRSFGKIHCVKNRESIKRIIKNWKLTVRSDIIHLRAATESMKNIFFIAKTLGTFWLNLNISTAHIRCHWQCIITYPPNKRENLIFHNFFKKAVVSREEDEIRVQKLDILRGKGGNVCEREFVNEFYPQSKILEIRMSTDQYVLYHIIFKFDPKINKLNLMWSINLMDIENTIHIRFVINIYPFQSKN